MELPNGLNWADGLEGRLGTATPAAVIKVQSGNGATDVEDISIEELDDSPEIERAEQATITHRFTMAWNEALTRLQFLGRGTLLEDDYGNITKILSATVKRQKPNTALLTIVAEGVNFDSPPDEFQITPVELNINIIKHPRYFYAFLGDGQGSDTEKVNQMVIRFLQDYMENPNSEFRNAIARLIKASIGSQGTPGDTAPDWRGTAFSAGTISGTDLAKRAALEIIQKYWRGEETPYIVGYQISWSSYYFRPQDLDPGGRVEDPITQATPQLPDYFWSPDFPPSAATIFDLLAAFNPQCYSDDGTATGNTTISWLREADVLDYQRTWFKVTRSWKASPVGFWDNELYNRDSRPALPKDYLEIDLPT